MNVPTTTLPDTPSELIRVALADLRACEADPRYIVDMGMWHAYFGYTDENGVEREKKCLVCLAGSVMAKSLGAPIEMSYSPGCYDVAIQQKLLALDEFRQGGAQAGIDVFYGEAQEPLPFDMLIHRYARDPEDWFANMLALATALEQAGH